MSGRERRSMTESVQTLEKARDLFPDVGNPFCRAFSGTLEAFVGRTPDRFDRTWSRDCRVEEVSRGMVDWMIHEHYLDKWPAVTRLRLGMFLGRDAVGCIIYAEAPRETSTRYGGPTWELARLWIHDAMPKNSETWLIGKSVRYIKSKFRELEHLVSYADPSVGHRGVIYRAANWIDDGMQDEERKTPRCDYYEKGTDRKIARFSHAKKRGIEVERRPRVPKHRYVLHLSPASAEHENPRERKP